MLRDLTWLLIGIAAIVGAIGLTAADKLPSEVMAALLATVITAIFGERETNKVRKSWEQWAREHDHTHTDV